jgi:CHAD domain-containing protein
MKTSVASRRPGPDTATHLEHTLDARWRRYRKAFDRCWEKFSETSVHQLRVESRRLLALVNLLDALIGDPELRAFRRLLKRFFRRFARLRDTQVQLLLVRRHRRKFPEVRALERTLAREEQRLVRKLDRKVRRSLRRQIKAHVTALRRLLKKARAGRGAEVRGNDPVVRHVQAAFHRVVALRRRIQPGRPATIHRTRVAFKRFRYLAELLQPLLPGVSRRQFRAMHDYQGQMGEIQDLEILQARLEEFARQKPGPAGNLARFRDAIAREHTALIARYLKHADQLLRFWPTPPSAGTRRRKGPSSARAPTPVA